MNKTATTEQIVVEPYRVSGSWVFDFPPAGVIAQPFARGIPEMLDIVLARKHMENVREFRLSFSSGSFPEWDGELVLVETEPGGPRYRLTGVEGELSGRLFLLNFFFPEPPQKLYFRVEHIEE
ncbi:MAG: hypothetical protein IIA55_04150 [Gemmatimonadetes bacterium]|nr:hypothetical protein [Gemmatimonadota bacterium]